MSEEHNKSLTNLNINLHSSMPSLVDFGEDVESVCDNPKSIVGNPTDSFFTGKTVVITGAGGQFGRYGCLYFAKRGARIAALDQNKAGLKETFDALETELKKGRDLESEGDFDFKPYVCDVTNVEQINAVMEAICERFQRYDEHTPVGSLSFSFFWKFVSWFLVFQLELTFCGTMLDIKGESIPHWNTIPKILHVS